MESQQPIKVTTRREYIRHRPGMYFGGTDIKGLHYLIWELLNNSIDEAVFGICDHIILVLKDNATVSISDNGSGIPLDIHEGISILELVATRPDNKYYTRKQNRIYSTFFGIGLSAVNIASVELKAEVKRDGYLWEQIYRSGVRQTDLIQVRPLAEDESTGTTITFTPDFTIFQSNDFNHDILSRRLRELGFTNNRLKFSLLDERSQSKTAAVDFYYPNGSAEFVGYLNRDYIPLHKIIHHEQKIEITPEHKHRSPYNVEIEFAFQYIQENASLELSYANTTFTPSGGTHVDGFKAALDKVIGRYDLESGLGKYYCHDFVDNDLSNGLTAVVAIKHPDIQLSSQFRPELINPEVKDVVYKVALETLEDFANTHPDDMRRIVERCLTNRGVREKRRG